MTTSAQSLTLLQLNQLLARLMTVPQTQNVWVTAELSDVAVRGGHCYMELLQKDERGTQQAKARGVIWANNFARLSADFLAATGRRFETGLKVRVRASVSMHPVYGMSLVISAVDPAYSMGDLLRRRREILLQLQKEGILELNRSLQWPDFPSRVAVISAPGAAGYGDFINQLYNNPSRLRFTSRLYPAVMQGDRAPATIIAALEEITASQEAWDCVVIIRGGGATSDLQAFEDYDLASAIAQFPLPVIIGIGHERDITVLDYVANMRVKTPTAAAEWLISRGDEQLAALRAIAGRILQSATDFIASSREQLSYLEALMPVAPVNAVNAARQRLHRAVMSLSGLSGRRISPALERLRITSETLPDIISRTLQRRHDRLDSCDKLLHALSPDAVLARGYSITRVNGHAVTSAADLHQGDTITTTFADGSATSTITQTSK